MDQNLGTENCPLRLLILDDGVMPVKTILGMLQDAGYMVRGLRALSDFEWELQLSLANHSLDPAIETICLMASQEHSFLSSSVLKEIAMNGGSINHLAPPCVVKAFASKEMIDEDGNSKVRIVSVRD